MSFPELRAVTLLTKEGLNKHVRLVLPTVWLRQALELVHSTRFYTHAEFVQAWNVVEYYSISKHNLLKVHVIVEKPDEDLSP